MMRRAAAFLVLTGGVAVACSSADVQNRDYGVPPDAAAFDPGRGGGDGYGSGGAPPFVCPDELKRCPHAFTYPFKGETSVELRGDFGGPGTWQKGVAMANKGAAWTASVEVPYDKPVHYKFFVSGAEWKIDPTQPTEVDPQDPTVTNNVLAATKCDPATCAEDGPLPPGVFDWRDAVVYFAFVDRFANGSTANDCTVANVSGGPKSIANYQGGDWAGITAKIGEGYFDDLGVNTLWITVPFQNPDIAGRGMGGDTHTYSGYHGYWPKLDAQSPATLEQETCFGTFADLKALVAAAHAKKMKVVLDYAMVHVHSTSQVYQQHQDWFWPLDFNGGQCVCDDKGVCPWKTQGHRCWFTEYLPHWDYTKKPARDYSVTQAVEWIKQTADAQGLGVDGFRADAIKHVDGAWLNDLRARIDAEVLSKQTPKQRFWIVGETYDFDDRAYLKTFVDPATKLDGQFDFPLRKVLASTVLMRLGAMSDLASFMDSNDYFYGANAVMSTFIGNHDLPRVIHLAANARLWGDDQGNDGKDRGWQNQPGAVGDAEAYERVANAFAVLFTNRGAPLVYYGDEIGMPGAGDPDNRRFMQWSGLSANQTMLRDRVKALGKLRQQHPALRRGMRKTLAASQDVWVFSRTDNAGDTLYVAINRSDSPKDATGLPGKPLKELLGGTTANGPTVSIPPRQTRIFVE